MYYNTTYKPKLTIINVVAWRASREKNDFHKERSVRTRFCIQIKLFLLIHINA